MSCVIFSSRRRHTRFDCDWSSDVCSSDLLPRVGGGGKRHQLRNHPPRSLPGGAPPAFPLAGAVSGEDRKSTRLNSSHSQISYAAFCLKKKNTGATRYCRSSNCTCSA